MKSTATILLVEDDKSMLDGMSDLLQAVDIGYEIHVLKAGNGVEALHVMHQRTSTPDLIISDIMMPEMDGFQFLNAIRAKLEWSNIPFVFLTARGEKHEISKGLVSDADLYITKPFQSRELLELLKTKLDIARRIQDDREQNLHKLKRDILQILNHEFRTPLTYVTAYYEMLADSVGQFAEHDNFQDYLHGIQAGCIRLTRLVEDFIQVMQLRTNEISQQYQQRAAPIHNIGELIQETVQTVQEQAKRQNIQLHYDMSYDLPTIFGDRSSLINLLGRLLDNAIKFTARNHKNDTGNVYLSTRVTNGLLYITVEDDGIGFPKQLSHRIFDLFFQYNRNTLEQQGAGTGLTIAKGLAELHNGRIEADSQENVGSTFSLILPIYDPASPPPPLETNRNVATVLIVEDDRHLMEGLQELLEIYEGKYRLKTLTAPNGVEGLATLRKNPADLIISDIMMPQMDGYEFLQKVTKESEWLQIPFIFLTAKSERSDVFAGLQRGAAEFIAKPYDSDELLGLVIKQLDRRFRTQDLVARDFEEIKRGILRFITPDFPNVSTKINEYSTKLADGLGGQTHEEFMASLLEIQEGSSRLSRLVEDFIALAELKTGEALTNYTLRAEPVYDTGILLYEIGQEYTAKGFHVINHLNVDLPPVYGNQKMLTNAICRLIDLGIEHTNPLDLGEKEITLSAAHDSQQITLAIEYNTGFAGQTAQEINTALHASDLIEPSAHAPDLKTPGLNIVKGYVVSLHNGRIEFVNHPLNSSAFYITLPIYTPVGT